MEVNGSIGVKRDLHRYLYLEDSSWTKCLLQYGGHSDMGIQNSFYFPKGLPCHGDSWPHWDTQSSPGEVMWLQVCTAEQINSNTSLLLDTAASLEFNLLKLFEELKYAELCLRLNYVLSHSCSTVWCFQAISELLGWVFFFHWLLKDTRFYHVVLKLEYFNFVGIWSQHPWNP